MQTLIHVNNHIGLHQSTHTSKALQDQATILLTIFKNQGHSRNEGHRTMIPQY